jgi:hypothetical protein
VGRDGSEEEQLKFHLIEGDSKRYARVKVVETVIQRIEHGMTS